MAKLSQVEELDSAIRNAARTAEKGLTSLEIAEDLYRSFPELIEPFLAGWVIEKLAALVRRDRSAVRQANAPQFFLFERSLGIKRLPRKLPGKDGKPVLRENATAEVLERLVSDLRKKQGPALQSAIAAWELMRKYTPKNQIITYGEVVAIEAKKAGRKPPK